MTLDWGWLNRHHAEIASLLGQHALLAILPVAAALVIALPLGFGVFRVGRAADVIVTVLRVISSVPSLALLVALPVLLGPSILDPINVGVALTIYSVAQLVPRVVTGLRSVPADVRRSASAVGFGWLRRLLRVDLPLAMPAIFAGLRVVTVSNIALVSVAGLVAGGGLGQLFQRGYSSQFSTPLIAGLVLSVALALAADAIILLIKRGAVPWARGRPTT